MSEESIPILLAEENEDDFLLVADLLRQQEVPYTVEWSRTYEETLQKIIEQRHQLYLLDCRLDGHTGVELIKEAKARGYAGPYILLSSKSQGHETDYQALAAGAADYLIKEQLTPELLERSIRYTLQNAQDIRDLSSDLAERAAQISLQNQTFAAVLEATQDTLFVLDTEFRYRYMNPSGLKGMGRPLDEIIGKSPYDLGFPQDILDAFMPQLEEVLHTGRPITAESLYEHPELGKQYFEYVLSPIIVEGETKGIVGISRNITERKDAEETIRYQVLHDSLTGLANRSLLEEKLADALSEAKHNGRKAAVFFIDLDRFKAVNDTLGHNIGDLLLQAVADHLTISLPPQATIGRLSGDEFVVIMPNIQTHEVVLELADKILASFRKPLQVSDRQLSVSASIGIATYPEGGSTAVTLMRHADIALYRAKEMGRNTYQLYSEVLSANITKRLLLENSLLAAVRNGEFEVYYQPIVNARTGKITKAEALLRWQSPELGMVPPSEFIPLAEESGAIEALGEWTFRTVARQCRERMEAGLPPVRIAINLSPRQLGRVNLVQVISQAIHQEGLSADTLELEITESTAIHDVALTIAKLKELHDMGIHSAIDDFGSGYASLNYLKKLPISALKIDRSFISDCASDPQDAAIIKAIIELAHSLNLWVVAEGVEDRDQLNKLLHLGCDAIQGYLFGRPVPADEFATLLRIPPSHPLARPATRFERRQMAA